MKAPTTPPRYVYALLHNGTKIGGTYGKVVFKRAVARDMKTKAEKKLGVKLQIGRLPVGTDWETIR